MSWQLASFLVLGAVLLGGFAWYERSRPPSQVVALVAALAALAIAGRIAFAAIPNVKPTTDIVIFAGYALGAAPGFAVGALAGLVSNFWFGQGPWTPWQMAGWGLCGILGAALALGVRNAGRLTLAAVCGFAGIAYGALLNFSLMATYGGDLSLRHFLVLEGRAVPFDIAHAAGNVTLALIAGPAMVRMLSRFRRRFEWGRVEERAASAPGPGGLRPGLRGGGVAAVLLAAAALSVAAPARAGAGGVGGAVHWLESVQNRDGGFSSSPGDDSSAAMTGWAMLGLEAAGRNPFDVSRHGQHADRLPAPQRKGDLQHRRPRPLDPRPGRGGRRPALLRRAQPRRRAGQAPASQRLLGGLAERHRLQRHRPAQGGCDRGPRRLPLMAAQGAERRRRLGRRSRLAQHRRRDRVGPAGALGRLEGVEARARLPAQGAAPQRRLRSRRRGPGQQPVDRLGGPGNSRGRRLPGFDPP